MLKIGYLWIVVQGGFVENGQPSHQKKTDVMAFPSDMWRYFVVRNLLKIYALVGNIKNDLVKYFMQHIRNGLFIDLINT